MSDVARLAETNLDGRKARCAYYGQKTSDGRHSSNECNYGQRQARICTCEQPSSKDLPFFEFTGAGSRESDEICKHCKFHKIAHEKAPRERGTRVCSHFEAQGPREFDKFYCGCAGWD